MPAAADARAVLRREIRAARRALPARERAARSHLLCQHLARSGLLLRAQRVACFWPNDGEVDLSPLFPRLWQAGKCVYLPVIFGPKMWFVPFTPDTALADNRFGIPEPPTRAAHRCPTIALDVVLVPLVAFDDAGNRLGMGAGYYDRTFASLRERTRLRRPRLVGAAFEFQHRERIEPRAWDVPLDATVTETGVRRVAHPPPHTGDRIDP